ncbi:MAG: DUF4430 domain-containing protein [Clostridia bacterium]|nr:DUF4430 domain-containing protein [Clostridia bacterium]
MKTNKLLTLAALTALLMAVVLVFSACGGSNPDTVDISKKAGDKIKATAADSSKDLDIKSEDALEADSDSQIKSDGTAEELKSDEAAAETKETEKTEAKGDNTYTAEQLAEANSFTEHDSAAKDQYQTDPVPEGMPEPVDNTEVDQTKTYTCTLSITCHTIFDNMDKFNSEKSSALPTDGVIYPSKTVQFCEGETAFDVLSRECMNNGIQMDYSDNPLYNSAYIEGIHNLYEFDCGELSGWMYSVNGWFPNYGCSRYILKDGDVIRFEYTCDLGEDLGVTWME